MSDGIFERKNTRQARNKGTNCCTCYDTPGADDIHDTGQSLLEAMLQTRRQRVKTFVWMQNSVTGVVDGMRGVMAWGRFGQI